MPDVRDHVLGFQEGCLNSCCGMGDLVKGEQVDLLGIGRVSLRQCSYYIYACYCIVDYGLREPSRDINVELPFSEFC